MDSQQSGFVEAQTSVCGPSALSAPCDGGHDERREPDERQTPPIPTLDQRRPPRERGDQDQIRAHSQTERVEVFCERFEIEAGQQSASGPHPDALDVRAQRTTASKNPVPSQKAVPVTGACPASVAAAGMRPTTLSRGTGEATNEVSGWAPQNNSRRQGPRPRGRGPREIGSAALCLERGSVKVSRGARSRLIHALLYCRALDTGAHPRSSRIGGRLYGRRSSSAVAPGPPCGAAWRTPIRAHR